MSQLRLPKGVNRLRWLTLCTVGELAGIAVVAVAYAAAERGLAGPTAILAAGAGEGLCLGAAQALVVGALGVSRGRWVAATVAVALLGYAGSLALGAGGAGPPGSSPVMPLIAAGGAAIGLAMGVVMGIAQAAAARGRVPFLAWSVANALGWAAGMAIIMIAATAAPGGWPLPAVGTLGAASGAAAGLCVGLATWPVLSRAAAAGNTMT